jgi:hypothetical protein
MFAYVWLLGNAAMRQVIKMRSHGGKEWEIVCNISLAKRPNVRLCLVA